MRIVTVGGEGATTIGEVDQLNPITGRWSRLADLPAPATASASSPTGRSSSRSTAARIPG